MTILEGTAVGAIIVSLVTLAFNSNAEIRRKKLDRRADAYLSLLRGMSLCSIAKPDDEQDREGRALTLDARHRILLYGAPEVVKCCERYYSGPGSHLEGKGRKNFAALIQAMQKDCRGSISEPETIWAVVVDGRRTDQ